MSDNAVRTWLNEEERKANDNTGFIARLWHKLSNLKRSEFKVLDEIANDKPDLSPSDQAIIDREREREQAEDARQKARWQRGR